MINRFKNLKLVQKTSPKNQKLKWLMFNESQTKRNSEYIDMICSEDTPKINSDNERLEAMVRESLKSEFSNIESYKSYEFLVDAVMHNLRKKQLRANHTDNDII